MKLTGEGELADYLCLHCRVDKKNKSIEMLQTGLIDKILMNLKTPPMTSRVSLHRRPLPPMPSHSTNARTRSPIALRGTTWPWSVCYSTSRVSTLKSDSSMYSSSPILSCNIWNQSRQASSTILSMSLLASFDFPFSQNSCRCRQLSLPSLSQSVRVLKVTLQPLSDPPSSSRSQCVNV
jgi:hypothetical protein